MSTEYSGTLGPLSDERLKQIAADHYRVTHTFGPEWRVAVDPDLEEPFDAAEEDEEPYDRLIVSTDSGDPFKPGSTATVVFETHQQPWVVEWLRAAPERENELLLEIERLNESVAALDEADQEKGRRIQRIRGDATRALELIDEFDGEGISSAEHAKWVDVRNALGGEI